MTLLRHLHAAAFLLLVPGLVHSQTVEFGNIAVVQNDSGDNWTSVTLNRGLGSSPNFSVLGGTRADYYVSFGTDNDVANGVMISAVAQNGRDNTASGDTIGLFYATSAVDHVGSPFPNKYWVPVFRTANGNEVNIDVACAWFSYDQWLGGFVRNSTGVNGGANNTFTGSPGINLGTEFIDNGGGVSTVNLTSLGASSANGVLLVNHAKNEDNYALSRANADGTFTVWVHDNGVNGTGTEQDPVAFVYLPELAVGSNHLVAVGRVNSDATTDVAGGEFALTKGGTGQWYLTIPGHSNQTGVLMISPEGGGSNTNDNVVSYGWDGANNRWVIESRDLSGATVQPTLQNGASAGEDMFSFAFFATPNNLPTVTIASPEVGSGTAPANFTVEAGASDVDGAVTRVEFLRNGVVVGTDDTAPYTLTETALPAGRYSYVVRATDNAGGVGVSTATSVAVAIDSNNVPANTALWFDGVDDYVTMGLAPELNAGGPPTNGFTAECWFYKDGAGITASSGSGGVTGVPLFGKGRGEGDGSNIDCNYLFGINAAGYLVADFESYANGQNYPVTATAAPVTDGVWHHAAVTYDGNTATWTLYLDGVAVGTTNASAGALPRYDSIQHFGVGAAFDSMGVPNGAFRGMIDEVRVWNYARSAEEIAAAKDLEIGSAEGLIGRFGFNETSGTSVASSVAATVGTLTNGPEWNAGAPFASVNTAPTLTLTAPANNYSAYMPYPVVFEATASDADSGISKVQFFVDGVVVGEDITAPYAFSWTPPAVGEYVVSARALDTLGAVAVSANATIQITPNPNQPPVVSPGTPTGTVTGDSANMEVNISDPEGDATTVTFYGRVTTPVTPGPDFTFVAIPDTQYYSEGSASRANTVTVEQLVGTFGAQTQWVVENKAARNIAFVSHMGDIVNNGNKGGDDIEWQRASAAMGKLENPIAVMRAHGIPFGLAPGNHDIDPIGSYDTGSTAFFNQFFGISRFAGRDYWGGNYGVDNTNNYQLFSASGLDFIVIHLAYDTTQNQDILDWADALLKAHPHRRGIVTSHYIIGQGNPANFGAQGKAIYEGLKDNPNLFLLLCGHIHAEGRRTDVFEGRTVYSVLSDYQGLPNGGNGFLRTFTFSPANNRIRVESWSPTLGRAADASDALPHFDGTFELPYNMQTPVSEWVPLATVNVPAGGTSASAVWNGLQAGGNYEWYAAVTDGVSNIGTAPSRITTAEGMAPVVTLDGPLEGGSYLTPATVSFTATASDSDGSVARVEFYADGTKVGEDNTAPYSAVWTGGQPGTYSLTAVAVDNSGLAAFSNAATITVNLGDHLPTVSLATSANGTLFEAPAEVTLVADANDNEAPVAKVEFFSDDTLLGEDTEAPFSFTVTNRGVGRHTFTAKATDSVGQTAVSAPLTISVFTEAPTPNTATLSVGLFSSPSWTVTQTSPAPRQFNLPGVDVGDIDLRINGAPVPFSSGITLSSNWVNPAEGGTSIDNLTQPYANGLGDIFISVRDNGNDNAADGNPSANEETSGTGVVFLPFTAGWTGASVDVSATVLAGNLPAGVTITRTGTGAYTIDGLSTAGNLFACTNGDSGTLAENVVSVRIVGGRWVIDTRDNGAFTQNNEFSFVYIPPATRGVYAGAISSEGVLSSANAPLVSLGATVSVTSDYYEITFGDGTIINPSTAALFINGDSSRGGTNSAAADNLTSWFAGGNSFRIFTQDLPQVNGTFEPIDIRFVAIPFVPDSDGDGLADEWETANGLNPLSAADAVLDSDGDGLTNLQEFRAGSNPHNGTDTPRVAEMTPQADGSVIIQIPTVAGKSYRVEANNSFPTGEWTVVADNVAGTGALVPVPDPGAAGIPNRIYRVTVLP